MSPGTFVVEDPATLEPVAEVADQGPDDAVRAVDAAAAALPAWAAHRAAGPLRGPAPAPMS